VRRPDADAGSAIGNAIWFLVAGLWLALAQVVIGIVLCLTVIGIPFGIACFKMAGLALLPMGKEIVDADHPTAAGSGVHAVTPVGR
jgi:uncharacterized membrane protein YccF (DUF307 family)